MDIFLCSGLCKVTGAVFFKSTCIKTAPLYIDRRKKSTSVKKVGYQVPVTDSIRNMPLSVTRSPEGPGSLQGTTTSPYQRRFV